MLNLIKNDEGSCAHWIPDRAALVRVLAAVNALCLRVKMTPLGVHLQ